MTRGISEATDANGVTHYIRGFVEFVRLSRALGYYVTQSNCRWWCTDEPIPANSLASPGKAVDCMPCLVCFSEGPDLDTVEETVTGRMPSRKGPTRLISTPSRYKTKVFNIDTRSTPGIRARHQTRRGR